MKKFKYKCDVNGCLGLAGRAFGMRGKISLHSDDCTAHGNEKCKHKVKKDDAK